MDVMSPPEPNVPGQTARNYSYPWTRNSRISKYSIRGDHHFSGGDTLFGRISWQDTPATHTGRLGVPGAELHGIGRRFQNWYPGSQSAIGWLKSMGPNLVTELYVTIIKDFRIGRRLLDGVNWARELGYDDAELFPVFYPDGSRGAGGHPGIRVDGYERWNQAQHNRGGGWNLGFKYTASWRRGSHYLKFGFEHSRHLALDRSARGRPLPRFPDWPDPP